MVDNINEKNEIRDQIRAKRNELAADWIERASGHVQDNVLHIPEFKQAKVVSCYMALPLEVQTEMLIKDCWGRSTRVCVPCLNEHKSEYEWAWLEEGEPTKMGYWRVPELPHISWLGEVAPDLIIVPTMAADRKGGRLGHGGGHYDHLLTNAEGLKICLAFEFQVVDEVPTRDEDIRVDILVTEEKVYDFR